MRVNSQKKERNSTPLTGSEKGSKSIEEKDDAGGALATYLAKQE